MTTFIAITADQYVTSERYYKLPKILFENSIYVEMRLDSKVAYAFLRDRLGLSIKNNWIDENGQLYLIYSNTELMKILNCSKGTLYRIKKELAKYGLIKEVQQSDSSKGSLANRIYLGNLVSNQPQPKEPVEEFESKETTPVSNLDRGGIKFRQGGYQIYTGGVSNLAPSETEYNETEYSDYISSRKAEQNSNEFSQPAGTEDTITQDKNASVSSTIKPEYYNLLQVIADRYNDRLFGFPEVYTMTHDQKMKIGRYLASGYVSSNEVLRLIDRIPENSSSPLAYLLKSIESLQAERQLEAKLLANKQAKQYYQNLKTGGGVDV